MVPVVYEQCELPGIIMMVSLHLIAIGTVITWKHSKQKGEPHAIAELGYSSGYHGDGHKTRVFTLTHTTSRL